MLIRESGGDEPYTCPLSEDLYCHANPMQPTASCTDDCTVHTHTHTHTHTHVPTCKRTRITHQLSDLFNVCFVCAWTNGIAAKIEQTNLTPRGSYLQMFRDLLALRSEMDFGTLNHQRSPDEAALSSGQARKTMYAHANGYLSALVQ